MSGPELLELNKPQHTLYKDLLCVQKVAQNVTNSADRSPLGGGEEEGEEREEGKEEKEDQTKKQNHHQGVRNKQREEERQE